MLMTKRKGRQKKGYLGHRTHGRGNVKNRRGSGNRGGRGMAGVDKHKWSWAVNHFGGGYFGKSGFVRPNRKETPTVNLYEINQKALGNELEKREGKFHFDFEGKVLGSGQVSLPIVIRARSWSKNAEKKIGERGGAISKLS